jgi:hypothetical protein
MSDLDVLRAWLVEIDGRANDLYEVQPATIARVAALRAAVADMERMTFLRANASQKTAYDVFGNGGGWSIGFYSRDNRLSFDAALDAARKEKGK